jgi:hypothetical protein
MTDQKSRIADYYFRVGDVLEIPPDELMARIAQRRLPADFEYRYAKAPAAVPRLKWGFPVVKIKFPFDTSEPYDNGDINALIDVGNINPRLITGYSVSLDERETAAPMQVTQNGNAISAKGLKNGVWHVSVRAQYSAGKNRLKWSAPVKSSFIVDMRYIGAPVALYGSELLKKIGERSFFAALVIFVMFFAVIEIEFGNRVVFYARLFMFRLRRFFLRVKRLAAI